ncbi:ATP-dependent DNA helicase RecG [Herpetosiphon aurantiacus DSM 785]|uniref:ATP-dependent DNA helicase RecG n=1 Tax=Herpetosiphon aurantiacus (strain ATCC 23779 / DSM 785 / 114-95) TaxID=316274 RepID=A9B7G7_HERA2|nr:ATP-dependent DNA helicase RecG [Herpetosiphon aurantiacus DSM 785]
MFFVLMVMQANQHIIELGKTLAAEEKAGCDDTATDHGISIFLREWQAQHPQALHEPVVQGVLDALDGYSELSHAEREARLSVALDRLRNLFRKQPKAPAEPVGAVPPIDTLLKTLQGIGPSTARSFAKLGVHTLEDLLYHVPHRYDDFSKRKQICDLVVGETDTVIVTVDAIKSFNAKGRQGVEITVGDDTGVLKASWFRGTWMAKQFREGMRIVLSGKVSMFREMKSMSNPQWEPFVEDDLVHTGRLVPVHPLTKGLQDRNARQVIKRVVDAVTPTLSDPLPIELRERAGLLPLGVAISQIHFPDSWAMVQRARQRLGFDEFLYIQLGVLQRKRLYQGVQGQPIAFNQAIHDAYLSSLPFALTNAQTRTFNEICRDLERPVPMTRLVQGDVGSGKTAVAAAALVQAVAAGFQGAMMAPTEILAEQHYRGLKKLLANVKIPGRETNSNGDWRDELDQEKRNRLAQIKQLLMLADEPEPEPGGIRVALLTGSLKARQRREALKLIADGEVDIIIGTHALIQANVDYQALGLAVVDEQHRFGVEQREALKRKGFNPHLLVMTATPIPRSLALTIYGDLDVSVIDERPPGRQPIRTKWISSGERSKAYKHMRKEIAAGRQAFVICPLVEESEKLEDVKSAIVEQEHLQHEIFPDLKVGLIHGRMTSSEKDTIMAQFRDREFDILVATAVVEVGIDIPNATTIMIEGAERFGLAQLHQFRGRVGRGSHQSFCVLVSDKEDNDVTVARLSSMEESEDGFRLAEIDLELRGPGEFFGIRQSGTPDLKVAQLTDTRLLHAARIEAERILKLDPELELPEHAKVREKLQAFWAGMETQSN